MRVSTRAIGTTTSIAYGLTFDGTYLLTAKGTAEKPIVIKSAGDGEVIFDGDGAFRLFDVMGSAYNIFDGITFRNTEVVVLGGREGGRGRGRADRAQLPIRECRRRHPDAVSPARGISTSPTTSSSAATIITGRSAGPVRRTTARIRSTAITRSRFTGPGHVIAHNGIAFFHDGITIRHARRARTRRAQGRRD